MSVSEQLKNLENFLIENSIINLLESINTLDEPKMSEHEPISRQSCSCWCQEQHRQSYWQSGEQSKK